MFADAPEAANVAGEQRERDCVEQVRDVSLFANGTDVYLEADVALKHRGSRPVPLVLHAEGHGRDDTVRQLSHLKGRGFGQKSG